MIPYKLIAKKRDGGELTAAEINELIAAYLTGDFSDSQMAAFLMAAFLRGLSTSETAALTRAMTASGEVWDLSAIPGPKIDKHSTGGVGDKVSLVLAPWISACGVVVPMMSGRGLGHTGGTLDKLAAIPGFSTSLTKKRALSILKKTGVAMLAATPGVAPADRRMYALRDATGTVESIPLITASILSKKLAEGADGYVFDVKYGSGAFMPELPQAKKLAESLVNTAQAAGKKAVAVITAMDQPTGHAAGNACEVREAIDCLRTREPQDLFLITRPLAVEMLVLSGLVRSREKAVDRLEQTIDDGSAVDKLRALIKAQGGDPRVVDNPDLLPQAPYRHDVIAPKSGYIQRIDTRRSGWALVELGVGRKKVEDDVDLSAGLILEKKIGDRVKKGERIGEIMGQKRETFPLVADEITASLTIGSKKTTPLKLIHSRYDGRRWSVCH
jgi:pyrimidine-nucleoside phosphorylase